MSVGPVLGPVDAAVVENTPLAAPIDINLPPAVDVAAENRK